jgi:hypothetical protein
MNNDKAQDRPMTKEGPDRRAFLKGSALAASALAVGCGTEPTSGSGSRLHADLLRALADVVLPAELGDAEREGVVAGFATWLSEYLPVPELPHGYGSPEILYGPPDPLPRWSSQLEALDLEARQAHGAGFAELDTSNRRALLERALRGAPASLPDRPGALEADHVAIGLLGYFFGSSEATDLCYGRGIGGFLCRPLGASPERPPELPGSSAAARAKTPARGLTGASFPVRTPDRAS